jgi:ubiquinone/menaquinone biosynthesis C-methylase UbiE
MVWWHEIQKKLMARFPRFRKVFWRLWYDRITRLAGESATFLNYGYHDENRSKLELDTSDEPDRFAIQLYHHAATAAPSGKVKGQQVVEIGSGRGGGASYIARYLEPERMTGVDLSPEAVSFCNNFHDAPGLSYIVGDATDIPLPDQSCDVVVNVESSHAYPSFLGFLEETARILRPGGHLVTTDFREEGEIPLWERNLKQDTSLDLISERFITPQVLEALDEDHERKLEIIERRAPEFARPILANFAGLKGTSVYENFSTGFYDYRTYVLRRAG